MRSLVCCIVLLVLVVACLAQPDPARSRLGINLSGAADWNTEMPFTNLFYFSRRWISQREGAPWGQGPALARDKNGWITRLEAGCWADTPMLTNANGHVPPGDYVVLYDGKGKIDFMGAQTAEETPGRIVFHLPANCNGLFLRLRQTDPDDYVRNIRVLLPGYEKTYRTEPFHPAFLKRWAGFNTIRFKDWMLTDTAAAFTWDDRPTPDYCNFTEKGVPVEVMVALCNKLKINPWFSMPHNATDDYVRHFAELVKARLDPKLTIYLEYSNEVWNGIFPANRYAMAQAKALGIGPAERPWEGAGMFYTRRALEMFRVWEEVYGGHDRLMRVLAWQAVSPWWSERIILPEQDAFKKVDALAIAPYIGLQASPRSTPTDAEAAAWTTDQLLDYVEKTALPNAIRAMTEQKRVADKFGLKLVCYEAGNDLVGIGPAQGNEKLMNLFHAANRQPRMGAIFTTYFDAWKNAGGDLMCLFASTGRWSKYGSCQLLEYYDETEATHPRLKAVLDWNLANMK